MSVAPRPPLSFARAIFIPSLVWGSLDIAGSPFTGSYPTAVAYRPTNGFSPLPLLPRELGASSSRSMLVEDKSSRCPRAVAMSNSTRTRRAGRWLSMGADIRELHLFFVFWIPVFLYIVGVDFFPSIFTTRLLLLKTSHYPIVRESVTEKCMEDDLFLLHSEAGMIRCCMRVLLVLFSSQGGLRDRPSPNTDSGEVATLWVVSTVYR